MSPTPVEAFDPNAPFAEFSEPEAIVEQPKELAIQCVVFIGDVLSTRQKQAPKARLGGKLFAVNEFKTVPDAIVKRCAITRLRKGFMSIHKQLVEEKDWTKYTQAYKLKNQWNPGTREFEDLIVGMDGASKDLLFREIRPIKELGRIAGVQNGVVALDENCGISSSKDIVEAQMHYFPAWLEISAGQKFFPATLRELQDIIADRRDRTLSPHLRAIGDAYLQSCSDFYDWGKAYIDYQTSVIEETKKTPGGARYDEVGERLFKFLGLTRQDGLVQDFATAQNAQASQNTQLAEAMAMMAKSQARMDSVLSFIAERQLGDVPAETGQAPAPVTVEEAAAELDRASEEEFTDMSAMVVEPEANPEADATVAQYLGNQEEDEVETLEGPAETEE
jgi:hypothetical protein